MTEWISSQAERISNELSEVANSMFAYVEQAFKWAQRHERYMALTSSVILEAIGLMIGAATVAPLIGSPATVAIMVIGVGAAVWSQWPEPENNSG